MIRTRCSLGVLLFHSALFASTVHAQEQASIIGTCPMKPSPSCPVPPLRRRSSTPVLSRPGVSGRTRPVPAAAAQPGTYKVQAELQGFSTRHRAARSNCWSVRTRRCRSSSKLARSTETVTVTGESPLVDISSSQVAGNVDRRQMEELPLQGRNWMELSNMVKGITANNMINTPGVGSDDMFQLNLDGQQITQKIAGSGFGQPRFSREAIAEFQIITNCSTSRRADRPASRCRRSRSRARTRTAAASTATSATTSFNARRRGGQASAAVLESADWRDVRRPDRQEQAALLRVL